MDFQERQKQIYELSSFISEQEKWLEGVLGKLRWTKEYLSSNKANLEQCPYNASHYVPSSSLESHKVRCWYSSLGVKVDRETVHTLASTGAFYDTSNIPHLHIDHATEEAVHKLAPLIEAEQALPIIPSKQPESLESSRGTPPEVLTLPPNQIISYIKSWQKVPSDFATLHPSTLNLPQIKGWMFQNLPDKHTHSSALGGEIVAVETIMNWLSSTGGSASVPNLTPDAMVNRLTPMLGLRSKAFTLGLWKHIHTSRLQREHSIEDTVVEDIVPLTAAALLNRPEHDEETVPTISDRIKELAVKTGHGEEETSLPLPMDYVFYKFKPSERRTLYDYAVEVTDKQGSISKVKELDPDLYRDDAAALKAKLKAGKLSGLGEGQEEDEGGGTYLEQLKRKRDYRRRRQTYRAKNVHITRKTPREIFRDIISNRMEELVAAATEIPANEGSSDKQQTNDIHEDTVTAADAQITSDTGNVAARSRERREQEWEEEGEWSKKSPKSKESETVKDLEEEEYYRKRSRGHKRKRHYHRSRSRSRSGSRSRSKERHHKKHKKHRSRSRSLSREKSRRKSKQKHRSRSKSPSN